MTGLVTVFSLFTMTGIGETLPQTEPPRGFVADCKMKPTAFVGHVKTTFDPEECIANGGDDGSVRANADP